MKNPTMIGADENLSKIINPNFQTEEQRREEVEEDIKKEVFGE